MKIGILSDTHNNNANLDAALERLRREGVSTLIHCGDFTGADSAQRLAGFQVIALFGNGDIASGEIRETLLALNPLNSAGLIYTGKIDDTRIAATHGHMEGRLEELVESRLYEFIFHGHSHIHRDVRMAGTRVINPGSLGGLRREARQFCLLDLSTGKAEFVRV